MALAVGPQLGGVLGHLELFVLVRPFEAADLGTVAEEMEAVTAISPELWDDWSMRMIRQFHLQI